MNLLFFDDKKSKQLYPLTFTKPAAELRCGILTISEKWKKRIAHETSGYFTAGFLSKKFEYETANENILINGRLLPNKKILQEITNLKQGEFLIHKEIILAAYLNKSQSEEFKTRVKPGKQKQAKSIFTLLNNSWDIFNYNAQEIELDFELLTKNRESQKISSTNRVVQPNNIFIEKGSKVEFATLNPNGGYIYIGENSEVMESVTVRGSLAMGEHSDLKMGAKIYGATTIGKHCKAGGEINNSVLQSFSNKGHDGFLGNAVLGEWCNIGADTNNSNLKNNYDQVKMWSYAKESFERTGLQFCGLIMGDHSKCGINTMFNTGTVIGVSSNIYGPGFPRNFIPSFSWGGAQGFSEYKLNKAFKTAEIMMARRNIEFNSVEKDILSHVFEITQKYRRF